MKIQEAADAIGKKFQPEKIILLGSYAWGTPGPDSDVDLLVVQKEGHPYREVACAIDGFLFHCSTCEVNQLSHRCSPSQAWLRSGKFACA